MWQSCPQSNGTLCWWRTRYWCSQLQTVPPHALIPVRAESLSPSNDWTHSWRLARIKGLESQLSTFLFKLLHQLLPTQERVQRLGGTEDNLPGLCKLFHTEVEDLSHAFFYCPQSRVSGLALLGWVQGVAPTLQPEDALQLKLQTTLSQEDELAAVCMLATGLKHIWEARVSKKQITPFQVRAELEAKISLLRRTRYVGAGSKMQELLET